MDDTDDTRPQAAAAGSDRDPAAARWATLPEPVHPDDMVEGEPVGVSPDPSTLRDTETEFMLRHMA